MKKIALTLEVLKIISENGNRFTSTTEIHHILERKGIIEEGKAARKRLQRLLNDLKDYGYIESKTDEAKGKIPQEWRINLRQLPYFISYSEKELISLLTLTSFVPEKYRNLPVLKPAFSAIDRLGVMVEETKREKAKESFKSLPIPVERFTHLSEKEVELIFKAIIENKGLVISYEGKAAFEIFPIKIFTYNGVFYLSALKGNDPSKYRTYQLPKLKAIAMTNREIPLFYYRLYKDTFFAFKENPFLMKVELPADYAEGFEKDKLPILYSTQYHIEIKGNKAISYIVGFTGKRFASWLLFDEIINMEPADEKAINIAKEKRLRKKYSNLSYSLKQNREKFREFAKDVKTIIEMKEELTRNLNKL